MQNLKTFTNDGFIFKKKFGQNFIFDTNLLSAIVQDSGITKDDFVIEVGAGAGTLTAQIAAVAKELVSFEIDKELIPHLENLKKNHANLNFIFNDILKTNLCDVVGDRPFKVVANLPYYITTPVMFYFLENPNLRSITVMVQKEVAERFIATAQKDNYGAVSAQLQVYGTPKISRVVQKQNFYPAPKIDSAVVHLEINKKGGVKCYTHLQKTIAAAFAMRRKTLSNNLSTAFSSLSKPQIEKLFSLLNLPPDIRGEKLNVEDFIALSNAIDLF